MQTIETSGTSVASGTTHPFTMDGHEDALYYAQAFGGEEAFDSGRTGAQLSLPGLRAGEVDASFWAVFVEGEQAEVHDALRAAEQVDAMLAGYRAWLARNPAYRPIFTAADLAAVAEGAARGPDAPFGVLLHCEGARGIAGLEHLRMLYGNGLRSVGLTWNRANLYATGAFGDPATGLSDPGKTLVRELNALHMIIDGAHLNRQGLWDLLETSSDPILVTHTGCAALHPDPRNLQDDQIKAVAQAGGLIGVFHVNMFLAAGQTPVTLETLLAHYDHLLELVGSEHVALGTDYGGVSSGLPAGIEQVGDLPRLFAAFRARGYSDESIRAIRGGNYLRVLQGILK